MFAIHPPLEIEKKAIETKMVQSQEAEKTVFKMQKTRTDATILVIKAKAGAESILIQGQALGEASRRRGSRSGTACRVRSSARDRTWCCHSRMRGTGR